MKAEDLPFIYSTWLRSFRNNSLFAKEIKQDLYYKYHKQVVERILNRNPIAYIITPKDGESTILGYVIAEWCGPKELVMHFAYVKKAFRGFGLADRMLGLIKPSLKYVSHLTKSSRKFLKKNSDVLYCPYLT